MSKFIIGIVVGFVVATVGISGAVSLIEQGFSKVKEYVPAVESTVDDVKRQVTDTVK
jgi:hypothetical protein